MSDEDFEVDENGKLVPVQPRQDDPGTRLGNWVASKLPHQSDAQKSMNDASVQIAKNKAQMFALQTMAKFPSVYQSAPIKAAEAAMARLLQAKQGQSPSPEMRQPVQMQREFSSEEEKERYLEQVRKAMAAAGK